MTEKYTNLVYLSHSWKGKCQNSQIVWTFVPVSSFAQQATVWTALVKFGGQVSQQTALVCPYTLSLLPNPVPATHNIAFFKEKEGKEKERKVILTTNAFRKLYLVSFFGGM